MAFRLGVAGVGELDAACLRLVSMAIVGFVRRRLRGLLFWAAKKPPDQQDQQQDQSEQRQKPSVIGAALPRGLSPPEHPVKANPLTRSATNTSNLAAMPLYLRVFCPGEPRRAVSHLRCQSVHPDHHSEPRELEHRSRFAYRTHPPVTGEPSLSSITRPFASIGMEWMPMPPK